MDTHSSRQRVALQLLLATLYALLILPAAAAPQRPPHGQLVWERLGQELTSHAPIVALSIHPRHQDLVYVGAYHHPGLYKTTDGGDSWTAVGQGLEGLVVFAVLIDPADTETLYAGATSGLYRSTDGGQSWQPIAEDLPYGPVYALAMPEPGRLLIGTDSHGIYSTTDGGQTVTPLGEELQEIAVLSLASDTSGQTILAGTSGDGLHISRDGGNSWRTVPELAGGFVYHVAVDSSGASGFACSNEGLWETRDHHHSWSRADTGLEGRVNAVAFHPADSQIVYAGTPRGEVFRRDGAGGSWQRLGAVKRAIYAIALHPAQPKLIYAGSWDGMYRSRDGGFHWEQVNLGLGSLPVDALVLDQSDPQTLYAGNTFDGVYKSSDGGDSWHQVSHGLEEAEKGYGVLCLAIPFSSRDLVYAGTNGRGLCVSSDGGLTWRPTGSDLQVGIGSIAVHPGDEAHLYVRVFFDRVYESTDGGVAWQPRWNGLGQDLEVISLTIDQQQPSILYAGSENGLYKTTDGAASWQRAGLDGQTVFSVAIHPQNRDLLYAGTTDGLYRSTDGGLNWRPWGDALQEITISSLVVDPSNPSIIYAGTRYHGFFWSKDGGRTWLPANEGLTVSSVNSLVIRPDGQALYAATPDGIYRGRVQ